VYGKARTFATRQCSFNDGSITLDIVRYAWIGTVIDYDHSRDCQTLQGPAATLALAFAREVPTSLLDVGCGTGRWLRAAAELGIANVHGVDGIIVKDERLLFPRHSIDQRDVTAPFDLGRRFDVTICLEVAEHLPVTAAETLISSIVVHSDVVLFSAACPGQSGQHHINCQWPEYWQRLFNAEGYVCDDSIRWKIWSIESIEPCYRQNIFMASRAPDRAGQEPRIKSVVHPQMLAIKAFDVFEDEWSHRLALIELGQQSIKWYLTSAITAYKSKLKRKLGKAKRTLAG
jgi:SAM-dependent methyltransferase